MSREYSMGGRAGPSPGASHGGAPLAPRSLRERFGALRNLPPFLRYAELFELQAAGYR